MSLVRAYEAWPAGDRIMWERLVQAGGPLDDRGPLAHLRETSRQTLRAHYGRWLAWLEKTDPEALALAPPARVTVPRLQAWLEDLAHVRPMSRFCFVGDTLRVVKAAAPDSDWTRQQRLEAHLKSVAGHGDRRRKAGRILSSAVLFEAGCKHATSDAAQATTELEAMKRRRDGTMVAMLALMPMRRRAFANLRLGDSVQLQGDRLLISLAGELTKTGRPWEAAVPDAVRPLLLDYIATVRPWLMRRGDTRHAVLWVGDRGAPFKEDHLGQKIAGITARLTGVRVPPHFFRDAAATTLARISPDGARLIRPVLAHSGFETAERHYIHAGSIEAGRAYAEVVRKLKGARR